MKIGYARVSTGEQHLDLQLHALKEAGCTKIFKEKISGAKHFQPKLDAALASLKAGDTFVIWKVDRLVRSLSHLIEVIEFLDQRKMGFISITDNIDMSSAMGRFTLHILGAVAELTHAIMLERTLAGMEAARRKGNYPGRPKRMNSRQKKQAQRLLEETDLSYDAIASIVHIPRTTLWRSLHEEIQRRKSNAERQEPRPRT